MRDFAAARGFEDLWRLFGGRKLYGPFNGSDFRAQVARIVRHAPEVGVHANGAPRSRRRLREHLGYISRHGDLPLEGPDQEILQGKTATHALAGDWAWEAAISSRDTQATPICRSLVLSAPQSCDRDAVERGVRSFCNRLLNRFDFVFARHDDTPFPHAHLAVRARSRDGEPFKLGPADLWRWRELFAEELQKEGLEVVGTPRSVRGVSLRSETHRMLRLRRDYEAGLADEPKHMQKLRADAMRLARGDDARLNPAEEALLSKRKAVRQAFAQLANHLARSDAAEDLDLARQIESFLAEMPAAHTKRFLLAQQMQAADLHRAMRRQRERRDDPVRER